MIEFRSTLSSDADKHALDLYQAYYGAFGERERRIVPLGVSEVRATGTPGAAFVAKGHASVFNRKSLDLGGFQERIDPGAFTDALDATPDVHLLWDHDTRFPLARTMSRQYLLELREDPKGLHYYARVAPTSFAQDLKVLMEGGVIDQASFAFTVAEDTWEEVNRGQSDSYVLRTIHRIGELYDVTITARGAYPQTDSSVVRSYAEFHASKLGRPEPDAETDEVEVEDRGAPEPVASTQESSGGEETPSHPEGVGGTPSHNQDEVVGGESRRDWNRSDNADPRLRAVRFEAFQTTEFHKHLLKEKTK